jgi:hypothetical protein
MSVTLIQNTVFPSDTDYEIIQRAARALRRTQVRGGFMVQEPSEGDVFYVKKKKYVAFSNVNGLLGVFRIYDSGKIREAQDILAAITQLSIQEQQQAAQVLA